MMGAVPQTMDQAAAEYKRSIDAKIAALGAEARELVGKENHKGRHEKGRAIAALRAQLRYIDACRVVKGLLPVHGFFVGAEGAGDAEGPALDVEQAARLAAEAEQALKELEPAKEQAPHVHLPEQGLPPGIEDKLFEEWAARVAEMEERIAQPHEVSAGDVDQLQAVAQEVVDYKQRLHEACGYRNKDLREDERLHSLEDRLDVLAANILPEFVSPRPAPEAEAAPAGRELKKRAQRLAAKMVHANEEVTGLSPSEARELEQLLLEVAELKADMTKEGLHEHEQDRDERVLKRMVRVSEIRQKEHHDKKHDQHRHKAKHDEELRAELEQLEHGLGAHKQRLRDELGYSHKGLKHDPEVAELEERLSALHRFGGA